MDKSRETEIERDRDRVIRGNEKKKKRGFILSQMKFGYIAWGE
jgi:hypothetical protein